MTAGPQFVDYAMELLGPFGTVAARRMFGGHGIYLDDLMFAIVHDESLWLKTDEINRAEFEAQGCDAFTIVRNGKPATFGFHRAPVDALESSAAALPWARSAYAAAMRARGRRTGQPNELALAPFPEQARGPIVKRARAASGGATDRARVGQMPTGTAPAKATPPPRRVASSRGRSG